MFCILVVVVASVLYELLKIYCTQKGGFYYVQITLQ